MRPRYVRMYMRDVQTEQSHVKLVAIGVLQTRGACHLGADHGDTHGRGRRRGQQARLHPCKWCTARTVLPENCLCRIVYRITRTHTFTYTRIRTHYSRDRMLSCMNDTPRQSPCMRSHGRSLDTPNTLNLNLFFYDPIFVHVYNRLFILKIIPRASSRC